MKALSDMGKRILLWRFWVDKFRNLHETINLNEKDKFT